MSDKKLSVQVSEECAEEARDAVMFLRTKGIHTTLSGFVESALETELKKLRRRYTGGERLPRRSADLSRGRPLS